MLWLHVVFSEFNVHLLNISMHTDFVSLWLTDSTSKIVYVRLSVCVCAVLFFSTGGQYRIECHFIEQEYHQTTSCLNVSAK